MYADCEGEFMCPIIILFVRAQTPVSVTKSTWTQSVRLFAHQSAHLKHHLEKKKKGGIFKKAFRPESDTHNSPFEDVLGDVDRWRWVPLNGVRVWLFSRLGDDHLDRSVAVWGVREKTDIRRDASKDIIQQCYLQSVWVKAGYILVRLCQTDSSFWDKTKPPDGA